MATTLNYWHSLCQDSLPGAEAAGRAASLVSSDLQSGQPASPRLRRSSSDRFDRTDRRAPT